jgi:hypothetical protein
MEDKIRRAAPPGDRKCVTATTTSGRRLSTLCPRGGPGKSTAHLQFTCLPLRRECAVDILDEVGIVVRKPYTCGGEKNMAKLRRDGVIGVLLSSAGMFLGWNLGSSTASLLGGEPSIWAQVGKGLVWGVVIAGMQWFIVRALGVPTIRFLAASAVGFAVGYPLGQRVNSMMGWALSWKWEYWSALTIYGLSLTVPQWWIFRRHMRRASLWILFSMIGWMLASVAWLRFGVNSGVESIAYGIVTGLGLVWLVHSPRTDEVG